MPVAAALVDATFLLLPRAPSCPRACHFRPESNIAFKQSNFWNETKKDVYVPDVYCLPGPLHCPRHVPWTLWSGEGQRRFREGSAEGLV